MSLNLTCLKRPAHIRLFSTKISNYNHRIYRSEDENILSKFSSLITSSTFSSNDLKIFLRDFSINQWKLPTKLISSMIIYSSLSILLLMTCSIIFYIISYSNINRVKSSKYRLKSILILILIVFYLFFLIKMIIIIQNLNETKTSMEKSLNEMNKINSKIFSNHLRNFLKNFDNFSSNLILIDQTKLLIIKIFEKFFEKNYFLNEININLKNINKYFDEIIRNDYLKNSFKKFLTSYQNIINDLTNLNKKICYFIDQNHLNIEIKIYSLLNSIRKQFQEFIQLIDKDFFENIHFVLIDRNKYEQIRSTISIITTLMIIAIIFITIIPIGFFLVVTISYFYHLNYQNRYSRSKCHSKIRLDQLDVKQLRRSILSNHQVYSANPFRDVHRNVSSIKLTSRKDTDRVRNEHSYRLYLNPIRIAFAFVIILLIILCILNGFIYGIDLFFQSSCRLIHNDHSFFVSLITDHSTKSINDFDMNKILNNIINDCKKKIHFTEKFFDDFSIDFSNELISFLINFNENISKEFLSSIQIIDLSSELKLIHQLANSARLTDILHLINRIQTELNQINLIFKQITQQNSQISDQFVTDTLNQFELFVKKVIESTIDPCPLPMNNLIKIDQMICHETATLINGLWLRIFFFMFAILSILCILPMFIFKKFN